MAVDEDGSTEPPPRTLEHARYACVKGLIQPLDPLDRRRKRQRLAVDLLAVSHDARDRSEAPGDPHGLCVGEVWQRLCKEFRIELIGLAIDVEVRTREPRSNEGRAQLCHIREQLVDEAVLRLPQRVGIEPRALQENAGIETARMRRAEDEGGRLLDRFVDRERRCQLSGNGGSLAQRHWFDRSSQLKLTLCSIGRREVHEASSVDPLIRLRAGASTTCS